MNSIHAKRHSLFNASSPINKMGVMPLQNNFENVDISNNVTIMKPHIDLNGNKWNSNNNNFFVNQQCNTHNLNNSAKNLVNLKECRKLINTRTSCSKVPDVCPSQTSEVLINTVTKPSNFDTMNNTNDNFTTSQIKLMNFNIISQPQKIIKKQVIDPPSNLSIVASPSNRKEKKFFKQDDDESKIKEVLSAFPANKKSYNHSSFANFNIKNIAYYKDFPNDFSDNNTCDIKLEDRKKNERNTEQNTACIKSSHITRAQNCEVDVIVMAKKAKETTIK